MPRLGSKRRPQGGSRHAHAHCSCSRHRRCSSPASAQFYKDKTLTLLVNYAAGGNADTEARVLQKHLSASFIPGNPTVIIRNLPGAGGANAMNQLGLGIAGKPDGLTLGYFTMSATSSITDDPVLKVKIQDVYTPIAGGRGWNVVYARKDIVPGGYSKPADFLRGEEHLRRRIQPRHLARHAAAACAGDHEPAISSGDRLPGHRPPQPGDAAQRGQFHRQLAARLPDPGDSADHQGGHRRRVVPSSGDRAGRQGAGQSAAGEAGHHHVLSVLPRSPRQGAERREVSGAVPDERHLDQDAARDAGAEGLAAGSGYRRCATRSRPPARILPSPATSRRSPAKNPMWLQPAEIEAIFDRIRTVDPEVKRLLAESVGQQG